MAIFSLLSTEEVHGGAEEELINEMKLQVQGHRANTF